MQVAVEGDHDLESASHFVLVPTVLKACRERPLTHPTLSTPLALRPVRVG